nr:clustered mitochondria protein [Ipomoea batatas]
MTEILLPEISFSQDKVTCFTQSHRRTGLLRLVAYSIDEDGLPHESYGVKVRDGWKIEQREESERAKCTNATEHKVPSDAPVSDCVSSEANGNAELSESADMKTEMKESSNGAPEDQPKQGGIHLYPVTVKTQGGEKLELQLSPGDSVMDVKQFLLDAPETCFFTCYDLLLHTKDGSNYHLEDYNEISEVADITSGNCSLEMVPALYDDRSIRAHVHRTRELLSLSSLHSSLSTSLALQHESGQPTAAKSGEPNQPIKADIPELDNMGFVDNISSSLSNLLSTISKEVKCVESIVFSSFNPPPSYRRLAGDLIYLDVVTLEGNKYSITGTTKNFYANSSTANVLDPRPSKTGSEATTLIGLLQKISSKFKKAFREILEQKASAHPFENVQSLLSPNSWLGSYPIPDHKRDAARAENALTLSFGSELIGMQRDWNEELQSCREFPHGTPQERILRDRALYKVTSDFVDAATSGAIGVISRWYAPLPLFFVLSVLYHVLLHASMQQQMLLEDAEDLSSDPNNLPHGASEISNGEKPAASSAEHVNGMLDSAVGGPAENQLAESEQATYASANNDLKGTKAYQEADVPGLYNLAMAIIDYRGHRVVAQVVEAAKRLHLKLHAVYDGSGNILSWLHQWSARVLLAAMTGSRFCILRPELITAFCQVEATDRSKSKSKAEEEFKRLVISSDANNTDEIPRTEDNAPSQVDKELADEELVKKVSLYLKDVVLPKFVHDLCTLEVSPMDGQTLTEALHAHGINLRYLGKVAEGTRHFPHLWDLCSNEVVVRSAKHIFKLLTDLLDLQDVIRDSEDHDLASAISHFFNCFFGNIQTTSNKVGTNSVHSRIKRSCTKTRHILQDHHSSGKFSKGQAKKKSAASAGKKQSSYMNVTSDSLWSDIKEFSKQKYQFELPDDARLLVKKIPVLRNLCLKVGVTVATQKYDLDAVTPFQATDILNLQPVVKHSIPISSEAKDLVETGKAQLAEGLLNEAYLLFSEAFTILQQVTGPMHRKVANCCRYLAMVLYHAGDMAGAIAQQHKELIINERCLGLDHPDTAHRQDYGNMALFYHGLSQTELALRHMSRALLLLGLSSGPDHPDVAATFINVAMMYQDIGKMDTALRYLQESLEKE